MTHEPPVVARWGGRPVAPGGVGGSDGTDPSTPLVVLLHGRGSSEDAMVRLAPNLPAPNPRYGPAYASVRGPIDEGDGFTWYRDRERAQPTAESLATTSDWFTGWLDTEGDPERPVLLVGFSAGAVLAAGLMLGLPERWAGGALLHGVLPYDAGVPVTRGRLIGMPVFVAHGEADAVVPADLRERTVSYLAHESGAPVHAETSADGHDLGGSTVAALGGWLAERLAFLDAHGENPLPDGADQLWPTLPGGVLARAPGRPGYDRDSDDRDSAGGRPVVLPVALAYDAVAKGWAVADPRAGLTRPTGAVLVGGHADPAADVVASAIVATGHLAG